MLPFAAVSIFTAVKVVLTMSAKVKTLAVAACRHDDIES